MLNLNLLNPQQREAVVTSNGPILLLAGAGSGKTRVITNRIAYLVQNKQIPPSKILAVTFTNKAANEMKERVKTLIGPDTRSPYISTFHSLCVDILRKSIEHLGFRSNFIIYDEHDQQKVIKGILEDYDLEGSDLNDVKIAHWEIGQAKTHGKTPQHFLEMQGSPRALLLGQIFQEYQRILKGCNAIDFDDILNLALTLFEEHSGEMEPIRQRYQYIMVDEYQDTNRMQYRLLLHLCRHSRNLCVVGDDDQSIYGWRGADIRNILDFKKDFPEVKIIKLEQNYRSTQIILDAANQVISNNTERMSKKLWAQSASGAKLEWIEATDESDEMQKVIDRIKIQRLKHQRKYLDYAILYRSNFQSRVIEEAMRENNIPYLVVGATSFYDRKEVKDALAYLRLIYNPRDEVSLHRVINYPKRGIGQTSLIHANECCRESGRPLFEIMRNASRHASIAKESAHSMENFVRIIDDFRRQFEEQPLNVVFRRITDQLGLVRELEKQSGDAKARERKIACLHELLRSIDLYTSQYPDRKLKDYLERIMLFSRDDDNNDSEKDAVTLMTLHSAKGLEFPNVFMVGMAEGVFPNKRTIDEGGEHEERRLCYVGITRARKELTFSMARERKRYGEVIRQEPSRFLKEIDPELFLIPIGTKISGAQKEEKRIQARSDFFAAIQSLKSQPGTGGK
ncbi:MAG: UvrD-helicase domain-containing protein [SAR324 cluster bacterium]|nr:UvrD-helicase domain-containing protein [SAR324 cluster bacterium]